MHWELMEEDSRASEYDNGYVIQKDYAGRLVSGLRNAQTKLWGCMWSWTYIDLRIDQTLL